jgi:hypothetical protein
MAHRCGLARVSSDELTGVFRDDAQRCSGGSSTSDTASTGLGAPGRLQRGLRASAGLARSGRVALSDYTRRLNMHPCLRALTVGGDAACPFVSHWQTRLTATAASRAQRPTPMSGTASRLNGAGGCRSAVSPSPRSIFSGRACTAAVNGERLV